MSTTGMAREENKIRLISQRTLSKGTRFKFVFVVVWKQPFAVLTKKHNIMNIHERNDILSVIGCDAVNIRTVLSSITII